MNLIEWMDRQFYPNQRYHWDNRMFCLRILSRLSSDAVVLDFGAGADNVGEINFRGHVCGGDVDPPLVENRKHDEGALANTNTIPYPDEKFNVNFSSVFVPWWVLLIVEPCKPAK